MLQARRVSRVSSSTHIQLPEQPIVDDVWLNARSWGASKCAIRHVGPAMTVEQRWCDGDYTGCITKREKAESTIGFFFFFARQVDFGAKLSLEETQERATDVGPVKNKEKKRERERERERGEGRIKR